MAHFDKTLYLTPVVRMEGSAALAVSAKAWMAPFWVIRRVTDRKLANCTLSEINVATMHTAGCGGKHLKVDHARLLFQYELMLPVLTNIVSLEKDAELLVYLEPTDKKKKNAKATPARKRARVVE